MTNKSVALIQRTERRDEESDCDVVDRLPSGLRAAVHEYGLSTVRAFLQHGITSPAAIRYLVHMVLLGAREPGNRRPDGSGAGLESQIDMMLLRSGSTGAARSLVRQMYQCGIAILPTEPSDSMVAASMATVAGFDVTVSKEEKHRRRLRAALRAGVGKIWPWLVSDG